MPTGYTADVGDGKITEFRDFVWRCARGMGALITMRDEPVDAPIPEAFEPSTWNRDRLAKAQAELSELRSLTPEQIEVRAFRDHEETARQHRAYNDEKNATRNRYERMLAQVRTWKPPSADHEGLRQFMAEQLIQSIDFDCGPSPWKEPERLTGEAWLSQQIAKAARDIAYHAEEWRKEVERVAGRNRWLKELRESLG